MDFTYFNTQIEPPPTLTLPLLGGRGGVGVLIFMLRGALWGMRVWTAISNHT